jgi:hypothetical protein
MAKVKRKSETKKIRVTLDLTENSYKRLERLEEMIEVSSKADVIRQALQLLEFIAEKKTEGYSFHMTAPGGQRVLVPLLGIAA